VYIISGKHRLMRSIQFQSLLIIQDFPNDIFCSEIEKQSRQGNVLLQAILRRKCATEKTTYADFIVGSVQMQFNETNYLTFLLIQLSRNRPAGLFQFRINSETTQLSDILWDYFDSSSVHHKTYIPTQSKRQRISSLYTNLPNPFTILKK
jgi:hypothetical protein